MTPTLVTVTTITILIRIVPPWLLTRIIIVPQQPI
jgi:hypothetical protein